ncbi:uncharacterized protein YhfF [Hoeflea halophila]|uniref:Uncharacterized protein YhfF n=1 Tax=Hoeflea halophila TaxID=714899 RepID=A0A286HQ70_9HYPH|nr:ASCH domain-containing protein [Hoeflea halophila]SOE09973.1 uncharacterized protein YhfF [Hoeflea halophila]
MDPSLDQVMKRYPGAVSYRPGDSEALNSEIIELMRSGRKTATCATLDEFEDNPGSYPEVGRIDIVLDWNERAAMAVRTLSLEKIAYSEMDPGRVPPQGEFVDLDDWRRGYAAYLGRNGGFDPNVTLLYERFEVVEDFAGDKTQ